MDDYMVAASVEVIGSGVQFTALGRAVTLLDEIERWEDEGDIAEMAALVADPVVAMLGMEATDEAIEALRRRFALDQPALYRVMFGAEKQALMEFEVLATAGPACFGRLVAATAAASGLPGDAPLALQRAISVWALVHGWARLAIDGITCFLPEDAVLPASAIARDAITGWAAPAR
jgi:hypothetical protein